MVKLLMGLILSRLSSFYENRLITTNFCFHSDVWQWWYIYISSNNSKENVNLLCRPQSIILPYQLRHPLLFHLSSESKVCIYLIEELYRSFMPSEEPNTETFQTSSGVPHWGNETITIFNNFLDDTLRI